MGDEADALTDQFDAMGDDGHDHSKTCRLCGRKGLHWEKREAVWRLCDGRGMHQCPVKPTPAIPLTLPPSAGFRVHIDHEDSTEPGGGDWRDGCPNT